MPLKIPGRLCVRIWSRATLGRSDARQPAEEARRQKPLRGTPVCAEATKVRYRRSEFSSRKTQTGATQPAGQGTQGLKTVCENFKIGPSAAEAALKLICLRHG